jgi:quinone-modifying oxidoreductase subunit QmoA
MDEKSKPVLVIGGGIAGITSALEAAEAGCRVVLIEKSPYLGGRVTRMHRYFPKLCPPICGLEINYKRLKNNPHVNVLTTADLKSLSGTPGDYEATVRVSPRYVTDACTLCGACAQVCPAERTDDFNYGLSKTKASYLSQTMAFPAWYAIDRSACKEGCKACVDACAYGAIDLNQKVKDVTFQVASVVAATGWAPYDASKIDGLGFGKHRNVVTNVMLERMAALDGPTNGKIVRPSDGREPKAVAFVQCAGSRDENHLPYCSAVCCAASLKQAAYIRELDPEAKISIFYIDVRVLGRLEEFLAQISSDPNVELTKGKVAKIQEDPKTGDLIVTAEDVMSGGKSERRFDLVILATGIIPQSDGLPSGFARDEYGFICNAAGKPALCGTGCVRRPAEVAAALQDATGAALRALQCVARSARHG